MRTLLVLALLMQADMTMPTVTHRDEVLTTHNDVIDRDCPKGYEAHLVDTGIGFWAKIEYFGGNDPVFTICFKQDFMDKIRANKDLVIQRPRLIPQ